MQDYLYSRTEGGPYVPVSQMTMQDIRDCLTIGVESHGPAEQDVQERLKIELLIREKRMRP
jgi:hypothetical protein